MGGARPQRLVGRAPRCMYSGVRGRRDPGARSVCDRHHEPAGDDAAVGTGHTPSDPSGDRVAGPSHGGSLRRAPARGSRRPCPRHDGTADRPVLLRDEDRVAARQRGRRTPASRGRRARVRDRGLLCPRTAHRRTRHRSHECVSHDAVRHPPAGLGRSDARAAPNLAEPPPRGPPVERPIRRHPSGRVLRRERSRVRDRR